MEHKGSIIIQGNRIVLQPFKKSDAFFMFRNWANDPDVTRYMTWFPHKDIQETESVISMWEEGYTKEDFYQWAILLKKIDEPIGSIGVVEKDEEAKSCELGYCIGKPFWHQGYTTEAVNHVIKFLFEQASYLKPQFLFSNFAVGPSNEIAVKTAKTVASDPGNEMHNPLYLYGPSGVGKTHLLCAIANDIYINNPQINIRYVLADTFVGELIWGLRNGRYDEFRNKYRSADVLIVEDIQFLAGKASTQEEFYHIVDYLYQNNKQLIFSSNSHPVVMPGFEDLLRSKLEQSVIVGINTPDYIIRQNIITQLANKYELDITKESILHIAEAVPDSVRKVVGIMKMLRAAHDLDNQRLTEDNIKTILAKSKRQN